MSLIYKFVYFYDLSSRLRPKYHKHYINIIPGNHLDKLWFTFSEEMIIKFQFFFKNLQNIQHSIPKMDIFNALSRYHIITKTCHIYPADLSQIS